jgi:hypothetical protein
MHIQITLIEPKTMEDYGNCIFCNKPTVYKNDKTDKPVCALCSVVNTEDKIDTAPYNK